MSFRAWIVLLLSLAACGVEEPRSVVEPPPAPPPEVEPRRPEGVLDPTVELDPPGAPVRLPPTHDQAEGPRGFIGSACARDSDCDYPGGVCLTGEHPRGMCSLPCDRLCPDRDGAPVTFCVSAGELPADAERITAEGACVSRCSFSLFPGTGCRPDYGCVELARSGEPDTTALSCVPGVDSTFSGCLEELAELGVDFDPVALADDHPDGHPELTCHVEEPVRLHPPIHGVDLRYYDGSPSPNVLAGCRMALSLVRTIDDVRARGVATLLHYGTYNCRVISGTDSISRHGMGDAIDIFGFILEDGTRYTVEDHFEQDVEMPVSVAGRFMRDAVHRWHDDRLWSIILTPNYNAAHRDHFHVDLTPGSDYLNAWWQSVLAPSPHGD